MPEMPEVITVCKNLNALIVNKTISKVEIFKDKMIQNVTVNEFINNLEGETILSITNFGKHIIFNLTNEKHIISHLRMTGKYNTYKRRRELEAHDYVVFTFSDNSALFYNDYRQFGTFHFKYSNELFNTLPLSKLAQEPAKLNIDQTWEKIKKRRIKIKTLLLDQSIVVGIGNIYANEALWDQKIHPATNICNLTKKKFRQIIKSAQLIMEKSTALGGSSIQSYTSVDGKKGFFQNFLKVHGHENDPCVRCGFKIIKIFLNQRGTYFCPECQKTREN
ncbi:DNA-formamidopyrimidine glycosylase [Mycoplasma sp. 1018B]|uniref:DNA-formamidopyrimidine glycosylase n=1 Tax=Mycoplasma sp. 1018B TaxID=2967302 RepID=UPI00211D0C9A|nr:DNA-formamidopyrimidine glycosylase [Mycoplasma sp. 1018B]UUM19446.1 DNA-formamidopyrimidine glycosylase [Mycoplasma sp. 1018B]